MIERQNSTGRVNIFLHTCMNMEDNIQVVPTVENSACKPAHSSRHVIPRRVTANNLNGQDSTIDINQIPLTVNMDFFTEDTEEKDSDLVQVIGETNNLTVQNVAHRWSPVSYPDSRAVSEEFTFNAGSNKELQEATDKALQSGTIMPLVKEELKCSIQTKRLKEGKSELKVEFEDPKPDVLTPEEEVRVELRRTQNREAARRFRDRQKRKTDELQKECRKLELENDSLRSEIVQLRKERDDLSTKFQQHLRICPVGGALNPGYYTTTT